jgi:glycosyltransferase involved in cell wall biosynthesis
MNILMLHNRYQMRGGEDESFESEVRMLREGGHKVECIILGNDCIRSASNSLIALRSIWSSPSYRLVESALDRGLFDVLHVQNFFPLFSPSVYYAAKKHGVPVVQTLRNYRLLCPGALFFREGSPCELCRDKVLKLPGIWHKCYRGSRLGSMTVAGMSALHGVIGTWDNAVDLYIALTEFARSKFIQAGFSPKKIAVKSNFVHPDPGPGRGESDYALYVGRLTTEKGIETLLTAWEDLKPQLKLKIVGEGPLEDHIRSRAAVSSFIDFCGAQNGDVVKGLMGSARMLVFPSEWYETFGRVAIESFSKGTPVVAARIGAIAEVVDDQRTGLLFEPGNPKDLLLKLQWVLDHPDQWTAMRANARSEYLRKYTADSNLHVLEGLYRSLCPTLN